MITHNISWEVFISLILWHLTLNIDILWVNSEEPNKIFSTLWVLCMLLFSSLEYKMPLQFSLLWPLKELSFIEKEQQECTQLCHMLVDR